ncbi:MAG: patatin-like phospholipase family protein [Cyanobacteria bacterium]|nr:patatin-like phospholipase family protein [Cyanobacteriota bacterium]
MDAKGVDRDSLQVERTRFRARIADLRANECWRSFSGRVAVVLSGGGALGVYQTGVLLALQDGEVPTHILTATSVGSLNAASYAASSDSVVGNAEPLVQSWLQLTSAALGIEWTRYVFMLAGVVAAAVGFGNLALEALQEQGILFLHLHQPKLTWLFLGLAGISVSVLHDRLSYLGYVARRVVRSRPWKVDKRKLLVSVAANATVWALVFQVLQSPHLHTVIQRLTSTFPTVTWAAFIVVLVLARLYWRRVREMASRLSRLLLRLPFRTGLFPNYDRTRLLQQSIAAERLRASPMRVVVTATDLEEGTERFFSNASRGELAADPNADLAFVTTEIEPADDLMPVLTASSALPIVYEGVTIGRKLYTDGSVVVSQPIRPAIRLGADVLFLVMTRSLRPKRTEIKTVLDLALRVLDILMAQNMRKDLKTLHEANRLCEAHAADIGVRPEQVQVAVGRRVYRYLKTFTVCPATPLDGSVLAFDSKTTESTIAQGYRDGCEAVIAFLHYAREGHAGEPRYRVRLAVEEAT